MKRILIVLATVLAALALTFGASPASAQYLEGGGGGGGTETPSDPGGIAAPGGVGGGGAGGGALSRTGSNVLPLIGIAGAALLLGGAFVYGARKPREA